MDTLQVGYLAGMPKPGPRAIYEALIAVHGTNAGITVARAVEWDRAARAELARKQVAVTPPVALTNWERDPRATPAKREVTLNARIDELITRTANVLEIAEAFAAQVDATRIEIVQAERLGAMYALGQRVQDAYQPADVVIETVGNGITVTTTYGDPTND